MTAVQVEQHFNYMDTAVRYVCRIVLPPERTQTQKRKLENVNYDLRKYYISAQTTQILALEWQHLLSCRVDLAAASEGS